MQSNPFDNPNAIDKSLPVEPGPPPVNPEPASRINLNPPHDPSVYLNPQQQQENVAHADKVSADKCVRVAVGRFATAMHNYRLNWFATGKKPASKYSFDDILAGVAAGSYIGEAERAYFTELVALYQSDIQKWEVK